MKRHTKWVRIAYCRDIPLREGRAVGIGDGEIAIFNLGDRFIAVANRCPHKGGPLADGIVSGATVVCPLHAWKVSLETGRSVDGPAALNCVETFPLRVEDGVVLLQLSDERSDSEKVQPALPALCVQPPGIAAMTDYLPTPEA
jgi:nitrite reductase (NADH) small subunit